MKAMNNIINIKGIDCYEENGTAYLRLEPCCVGLGFTQIKEGKEYVRWDRVKEHLDSFGFSPLVGKELKDTFVPENIFYRLAMKARNEAGEKFQAFVADEVIPSIRKTGSYSVAPKDSYLIEDSIERAKRWIEEEEERRRLALEVKMAQPKVEYFDALVDSHLLTGIRETAKELKWKETEFVKFLIANSYMYRKKTSSGGTGKLTPYAEHVQSGLFEVKDKKNDNNGWSGTQVFITPKGKETFRLLHEASLQARHI